MLVLSGLTAARGLFVEENRIRAFGAGCFLAYRVTLGGLPSSCMVRRESLRPGILPSVLFARMKHTMKALLPLTEDR